MTISKTNSGVSFDSRNTTRHVAIDGLFAQKMTPAGATPELDSLLLFGSGLLGVAGYLRLRRRACRGWRI